MSERWQQICQIADSASGLRPEERPRFLDSACEGDPDLRNDVESFLRSIEVTREFSHSQAELPPGSAASAEQDSLIAKQVGSYRIVERIGSGGMGVVYRAVDTRLGRQAALKFLSENLQRDPRARERFEREARSASTLNHPNICTVYGVGDFEGHPYIALEFLKGQTLSDVIRYKPLPIERLVEIASRLAQRGTTGAATIGVQVQPFTPPLSAALGANSGLVVAWVDANGPAAGQLAPTDVIERVDDRPLTTMEQWEAREASLTDGESVTLTARATQV